LESAAMFPFSFTILWFRFCSKLTCLTTDIYVAGSQPTQTISATETTSEDNQEVSTPVERSNSDQNTSNWPAELKTVPKWSDVDPGSIIGGPQRSTKKNYSLLDGKK
jgi:hypothetical protein